MNPTGLKVGSLGTARLVPLVRTVELAVAELAGVQALAARAAHVLRTGHLPEDNRDN